MSARLISRSTFVVLALLTLTLPALGQPNRPGQPGRPGQPPFGPNQPVRPGEPTDADAAAGCAACGGMLVFFVIIGVLSIVGTVVWIFVVIWVAKDSKARGMENGAMWIILVLFLGVLGLIIYIVSRPQGEVIACPECGGKRLRELKRCPHCRAA